MIKGPPTKKITWDEGGRRMEVEITEANAIAMHRAFMAFMDVVSKKLGLGVISADLAYDLNREAFYAWRNGRTAEEMRDTTNT